MRSRFPATSMWAHALEMLEQADRLHRQFFQPGIGAGAPSWEPPVDVVETGDGHRIIVALPGVEPDRIRVYIDGGALVITGERPLPAQCHGGAIRRLEIPYGRFQRRIAIPSGQFELYEQRLENGCLLLGLRQLSRMTK
ncbi:MAG TPA: Hsp20/alpha crystallin family protein [Burkholderiales bacterium]|nr:Hsp20/alpha crystallin family protein [Burkholderiales bacterium]